MKLVNLDELIIGEGRPKICVPIVAKNLEEANSQASEIANLSADLIEIRGDYFEQYFDSKYVINLIHEVKLITNRPVIYTFRTGREGGEKEIETEEYVSLLKDVIESKEPELIDIELFTGEKEVEELTKLAHANGVKVVLSNHDFEKTPHKKEIYARLKKMEEAGADIAKIAVMPKEQYDVNKLLDATTMAFFDMDIPIVTMSMGKIGAISRISGEVFGSAITFGTVGKASAPGQINVDDLSYMLEVIHRQCVK